MKTSMMTVGAALASFAVCNSAMAQTGPTLYGVVDTFLTNIRADGAKAVTRLDASGLYASRVGIRGSEDLGNGMKANFVLEIGLNSDDGTQADASRLFNRQSWIGLSQPWGEVRIGRQNTPQFTMNGKFDAFSGTTQASGWNNMFGAGLRVDNAISVFSPDLAGFKLQAMYGRGAVAGGVPLPEVSGNKNLHLAVEYERGPAYLGTNYEEISNTALAYKVKRIGAGGSYRLNERWQAFGAAGREESSNAGIDSNLYSASLRYQLTPQSSLAVGYTVLRDHVEGVGHGNATQGSIQYRYLLSKRTTIYTGYAQLQQRGLRNSFVLSGAAVVQPAARITASPGGAITGVQVGIAHTF